MQQTKLWRHIISKDGIEIRRYEGIYQDVDAYGHFSKNPELAVITEQATDIDPFDLLLNPYCSEYEAKFNESITRRSGFSNVNESLGLKTGDVILFKNGYDLPMISKILGFDKDGQAFMLWECYWAPIRLSNRLIKHLPDYYPQVKN